MSRKLWLVMAALVLSACQEQKPEKVEAVSAPATVAISTAPAVATPAPTVEAKPVTVVAAQPVAKPDATPKPNSQSVVAKPVVPQVPAAPKVVIAVISDADGIALAKKRNCFACHMVDKKIVGPAWKDVATKYRGDAGAQARMEAKIGKGGSGAWGSMSMPPQPQVTTEERALLAWFILNLK